MTTRRAIPLLLLAAGMLLPPSAHGQSPPVQVVLFTHIEDNTPNGVLGSPESRNHYLLVRGKMISMAHLAANRAVPWSLQPDWKLLQAALLYEDAALMQTTNGKNFLRYLKEDLDVVIDPHSHENFGYNYTDVAHLLDSLGVGGSTVIGGHIWDPDLPQFQEWDRFRVPVQGEHYPSAWWRGDILMGSGTPNHVNDPIVSGVWRPMDRYHYFLHDGAANIAAVGQYKGTMEGIRELAALYESGAVPAQFLLTSSHHIKPATITAPGGLAAIEDTVLIPLTALRDAGTAAPTDFTTLVQVWQTQFASRGFIYDAENPTAGAPQSPSDSRRAETIVFEACGPNPCASATTLRFWLRRAGWVRLGVYDVSGREVTVLVNAAMDPGSHTVSWDADGVASGAYVARLHERTGEGSAGGSTRERKILLVR